jgi:1-deoxy-D-xylulose-5-phosphate reductoisomerase
LPKRIAILGSTGSIGRQTLAVVEAFPGDIEVVGLACGHDGPALLAQAARYRPQVIALAQGRVDAGHLSPGPAVFSGPDALTRVAAWPGLDLVVVAVSGLAGLAPTLAALGRGIDVALANKETMVAAGDLVMAAAKGGGRILPVDSEHSALWQCLEGRRSEDVRVVILTASGGPFRTLPPADLEGVDARAACVNPNWSMGRKISVDSATLMNKGLEVIEARWLFGLDYDRLQVVVHPESVVHAMVGLCDGTFLACLSRPDMRLPIQYALFYPERKTGCLPVLDPGQMGRLSFEPPDLARFPCLELAWDAGRRGFTFPCVLNAANEVAVERFLAGELKFTDIPRLVSRVLAKHLPLKEPGLETVLTADRWARTLAGQLAGQMGRGA